jgi:ABC-type iron transport system FetAB ATPase subunit
MDPALTIKNLRSALAGPFDLTLPAGACAAVSGPSGSGKSLFLRMIADLDPNEGEVWLGKAARSSMSPTRWRRNVVFVAAQPGWWADSVTAHFPPECQAKAKAASGRLGLAANLFDAEVARLSTGEKQRFALVRALVRNPPVLLLDEPTAALDERAVQLVEELLRERMAAGTSIVLVTHDPDQSQRLGMVRYRMAERKLEPL